VADKVELSSIRISAELDASPYKRGAADIVAANKAISDTSKQTDSNVVSLQTKISQSGDVLARLSRQYVDGYASAQRFHSALQQLSNGMERGRITMAQATPILDGIYRKYGIMADASQFAARGQLELANAVEVANERLAQQQHLANDNALGVHTRRIEELRIQFDSTYAAARRLDDELRDLAEAERLGALTAKQLDDAMDGLIHKYDATAQAARRAREEHEAFIAGRANQRFSQSMGVQDRPPVGGPAVRSSAAVFEAEFARVEEIARQKAQQIGRNFNAALNESFGMGIAPKQAAASMAVFEEAARDTEMWAQKTALLKASLDPAAAAVERMNAEVAEYSEMLRRGTITAEQFAQAQQQSQQRHIGSQADQGGLGRFGAMNAAAQFQDIAVTAAMGQSPLTIALQQGTQLGQALESGMKAGAGLRGIVNGLAVAFTSLLTPANMVGIAFAAALAGAIQLGTYLLNRSGDLKKVLEDHKKLIDDIAAAYPKAAAEAKKYHDQASQMGQAVLTAESLKQRKAEVDLLATSIRDITAQLQKGAGWGVWGTTAATMFAGIGEQLENNEITARQLSDRLGEIRLDPNLSAGAHRFAEQMQEAVEKAADLEANIKGIDAALRALLDERPAMMLERRQLQPYVGQRAGELRILEDQRLARIQQDRARTDAERLAAAERVSRAERPSQADIGGGADARARRAVADEQERINEEIKEEVRLRRESRDELIATSRNEVEAAGKTTVEAARLRKEFELLYAAEVAAKNAGRTVSDAERDDIRRTAAEYAKLQAQAEAINAAMERRISRQRAVSDAQHEVDIVGQTARETAYLNSVYQQQQAIKEEAIRTGQSYAEMLKREGAEIEATARKVAELTALQQARAAIETRKDDLELRRAELGLIGQAGIARDAEIERIRTEIEIRKLGIDTMGAEATRLRQLTEELNRVAEATAKKNLQDDLAFERRQIFRTPEDQEIASRLRSAGLDENLNSAEAQMIRFNQQLERMKDTWQEIFDTVDNGIDSMVDVLFDGTASWEEELKKIGRQFARQMFDLALTNPLKNWLTGANTNTIADLGLFGSGASSGRGGGFGGALGGLLGAQKAVSSMQVQAATVVVNGSVVNGIPGVTDVAGTAKAATSGGGSPLRHVGGAGSVSSNFDTAVDTITTGSTGSVTRSGRAVDLASSLTGLNENANAGQINSFLRSGGVNIDAAQTAWCAAFVNSSLKKVGIQGTNSNVATSFLDWGTHVDPSKVLRGDVLVQAGGRVAGATGGHVGFATGDTRQSAGGLQLEMLAGNAGRVTAMSAPLVSRVTARGPARDRRGRGGRRYHHHLCDQGRQQPGASRAVRVRSGQRPDHGRRRADSVWQHAEKLHGAGRRFRERLVPEPRRHRRQRRRRGQRHAGDLARRDQGDHRWRGAGAERALSHGRHCRLPVSTRYVDDGVFMNARRYHGGGLAGDEVPAILRRGEPVFPSMAAARRMFANDRGYNANRNEAPIVNLKNINVFDPSVVGDYTRTDSGEQAMINMMRRTGSARGL
jgi:uncharacterized protein (TIGR02594 family)